MYDYGKGVGFITKTKLVKLDYGDTDAKLFLLPPGSYLLGMEIRVVTAFEGGTTTMDLGITGDADYFADDIDISSAGIATKTVLNSLIPLGSRPVQVTAAVGADNTAGDLRLYFIYICDTQKHLH